MFAVACRAGKGDVFRIELDVAYLITYNSDEAFRMISFAMHFLFL